MRYSSSIFQCSYPIFIQHSLRSKEQVLLYHSEARKSTDRLVGTAEQQVDAATSRGLTPEPSPAEGLRSSGRKCPGKEHLLPPSNRAADLRWYYGLNTDGWEPPQAQVYESSPRVSCRPLIDQSSVSLLCLLFVTQKLCVSIILVTQSQALPQKKCRTSQRQCSAPVIASWRRSHCKVIGPPHRHNPRAPQLIRSTPHMGERVRDHFQMREVETGTHMDPSLGSGSPKHLALSTLASPSPQRDS